MIDYDQPLMTQEAKTYYVCPADVDIDALLSSRPGIGILWRKPGPNIQAIPSARREWWQPIEDEL